MFTLGMQIVIDIVWALIVFFITALVIGEERKSRWFKKRTKYSFFNRRGFLGERLQFGYPKTWAGGGVTLCMAVAIALEIYLVYLL